MGLGHINMITVSDIIATLLLGITNTFGCDLFGCDLFDKLSLASLQTGEQERAIW